jgi:hypothetical protein
MNTVNQKNELATVDATERAAAGPGLNLQVSWGKVALLAVLLAGPWIVVGLVVMQGRVTRATPAPVASQVSAMKTAAGPWGELETTRIFIEPPEAFVEMDYSKAREVEWWLGDYTVDQAKQLLAEVGLAGSQGDGLLATAEPTTSPTGIRVKPSRDLILGLRPEQRAKLYSVLANWEENRMQAGAYRFPAEAADGWLANSGLSTSAIALVSRLLYRREATLLFADLDTVLPMLASDDERTQLIKTLARTSTLLVKVRIHPETDVNAMIAYWSKAGRAKDVKPLLTSIPRVPGGFTVDIAHLLPPLPRKLIYTYPYPTSEPAAIQRDCHWTSMNFFRREVEARFEAKEEVRRELDANYFIVSGKPSYGDVLMLVKKDGTVVHSCVYVAGDIVYTKNGPQAYIPWCLMELPDMLALYNGSGKVDLQIYRLKDN